MEQLITGAAIAVICVLVGYAMGKGDDGQG